ncbi:MAG: GNAT family N-acetyltransferase [Propionicimonas sp.]
MSEFHIVEARPRTDWVFDSLHALEVAVTTELFGEDQSLSAEWSRASYGNEQTALKGLLLALPGRAPTGATPGRLGLPEAPEEPEQVLGSLEFALPLRDNLHLMDDIYVQVHREARRGGIGSALWREVRRIAAEQGRTSTVAWSQHLAAAATGSQRLVSPTGVGHIPIDRATLFAQSLGLELAQVERESRLTLPVDPALLSALRAEAEARALPDYQVVSWVGPTPEVHRPRVAEMNRTLSADAPTGDLDWEEEVWDAERVRHGEEVTHRTGYSVSTLAIHAATGDAAGYTAIHVHNAHPHRPEQWNTAVAGAHRGHRLGLLIKAVNLQLLARTTPVARYVSTWNAGENDHMLAINTRIGFRLHSVVGAWKLAITPELPHPAAG